MRVVKLIQFTEHNISIGHEPTLMRWYPVQDMDDEIVYEDEDTGDEEYHPAIMIISGTYLRDDRQTIQKIYRSVIKEETLYNLIEIELDDNSQLFI